MDSVTTIEAFNAASNAGDLDGMLAYFADDATLTTLPPPPAPAPSVFAGKEQIRAWLAPQIPGLHVAPRNLQMRGTTVTWEATITADMFRQLGIDSFEVAAEAIVAAGKLQSMTVTQTPESVAKFARVTQQRTAGSAG